MTIQLSDLKGLRSHFGRYVFATAFYTLLAVFCTWPTTKYLTTKLPVSRSAIVTVPYFNMWTIWWNSDRALHQFERYWQAPIFFPENDTFAFSEPQPMTLCVAPIIWFTESRVLAYNIYLLGSLILNGLMTARLLRLSGLLRFPAFIGGGAMVMLPVVHWQIDVLQLIPLWGILWTWTALLQFRTSRHWCRGFEAGLAFSATCFISLHHALFLAISLVPALLALLPVWKDRRYAWGLVCAATLTIVLAGPTIARMRTILLNHEFVRPRELVEQLSASPSSYLTVSGKPFIDLGLHPQLSIWQLGQGWSTLLFALIGVYYGFTRSRKRIWTSFFTIVVVWSGLLSLGPTLQFGNWRPWETLLHIVPGISHVRSAFRFGYFVQMGTVILASQGLQALMVYCRNLRFLETRTVLTKGLILLSGLSLIFELRPNRLILAKVEQVSHHTDWIEFLRHTTPSGRSVACIPISPGDLTIDFQQTVRWMYYGTFHEVPLVNGYSGFLPESDYEFREALGSGFPNLRALELLHDARVEFLVIKRATLSSAAITATAFPPFHLEHVFSNDTEIDIYRLTKDPLSIVIEKNLSR